MATKVPAVTVNVNWADENGVSVTFEEPNETMGPVGNMLEVKVTTPVKLVFETNRIFPWAEEPLGTVRELGNAMMLKFGTGVTDKLIMTEWERELLVPFTVTK